MSQGPANLKLTSTRTLSLPLLKTTGLSSTTSNLSTQSGLPPHSILGPGSTDRTQAQFPPDFIPSSHFQPLDGPAGPLSIFQPALITAKLELSKQVHMHRSHCKKYHQCERFFPPNSPVLWKCFPKSFTHINPRTQNLKEQSQNQSNNLRSLKKTQRNSLKK